MAQKKYSPFAKKLQVHPVDDDGAAPEAATKTLEPATIREDYAQDVQYYKDLLAHQETGLLCCRSSLIINPKGRYMHCWDMVALVALLLWTRSATSSRSSPRRRASSRRCGRPSSTARAATGRAWSSGPSN